MSDAPDLIEPVVGFRDWRTVGGRLFSRHLDVEWTEPVVRALCLPPSSGSDAAGSALEQHSPPQRGCQCGVHAYHRPSGEFPRVDARGVSGVVTLWGRIEVYAEGMRAEWARLEALGVYHQWSSRRRTEVVAIADRLGLDLVDLEDLQLAAARYGKPIPAGLLVPESSARAGLPPRVFRQSA